MGLAPTGRADGLLVNSNIWYLEPLLAPRVETRGPSDPASINLGVISPKWYCVRLTYTSQIFFLRQRDIEIAIARGDDNQGSKSILEC